MVTPQELLALAHTLASVDREVNRRIAASRAYYAAFLHHRQRARARGDLPDGYAANVHARVERSLRSIDNEAARAIAILRSLRNRADYDDDDEFSVGSAGYALALGTQLLDR